MSDDQTILPGDRVRITGEVLYRGAVGLVTETRPPGTRGHCIQVSVHERGRMWYRPDELERTERPENGGGQ